MDGLPKPPFEIRLLHAAAVDAPSGDFATDETAIVVHIDTTPSGVGSFLGFGPQPGKLILDPNPDVPGLKRSYAGPELVNNKYRAYLADAVGVVTGNRAADFLLANVTLVNGLMDQPFVEYVWLTDASAADSDLLFTQPRLPYDGVLPSKIIVGGKDLDSYQREWLTRKWLRHADRQGIGRMAKPNHQAVFTLGKFYKAPNDIAANLGLTTAVGHFNDTWLAILSMGSQNRVAEASAHELAHQWRVNRAGPNPNAGYGHCGRIGGSSKSALFMSGSSTRYCFMTENVFDFPEASDGIVGFHYQKFAGTADSEYLHIRRRAEPVPQNEDPRNPPQ